MPDSRLFLKPLAKIGLFAPAGPLAPAEIRRLAGFLKELGFTAKLPQKILKPKGYLAGSDEERLASLNDLMADSTVEALMAIRGGYGSTRLLKALEPMWPTYPPKPIIGFSDLTALHMARLKVAGVGGWHGPMLINLDSSGHITRLKRALIGPLRPWKIKKTGSLKTGRGRGRLIGGNLSLLVSLLSSPYFPDSEGAILLIEDRGEKLYRLDRMLTTLRLSGRLENLAGLLFGDFGPNIPLKALKPLLMETALACPGPTAFSPVFGHGPTNRPWPVGGLAELAVDQAGGSLTFLKPD